MRRRTFLQWMSLAGVASINVASPAWAVITNEVATQRKMIVILLRGAIDGLNVVIPYGDANYFSLRPTIAIPRPSQHDGALDLDGYFGLHPALVSLKPYWQRRQLAFVHAAGSSDPTRSHFEAQDYIETGTPGLKSTPDGWMNRLVALLPGMQTPTRAVYAGPVMPKILSGHNAVSNFATDARPMVSVLDRPFIAHDLAKLYQQHDAVSQAFSDARQAHREINDALESDGHQPDNGAPLPFGFPRDASTLAAIMRNDPRVQMGFMALGGWDTHVNQGGVTGQLAAHLTPLGEGLAALAEGLGPAFNDTVIIVMSEFGRTVRQNGNRGTDHGHGNAMWLMGGSVVGKQVHGQWPGLNETHLYAERDLAVTTDFRSVLWGV